MEFFHRHDDVDIDHVIEMGGDLFQLVRDMVADSWSDLNVLARQVQVHGFSFF